MKQKWRRPEETIKCPHCGGKFRWSMTILAGRKPKVQVIIMRDGEDK
jgi:hypothetical protein